MKNQLLSRCGKTGLVLSIGVVALTALNTVVTAATDAVIVPVDVQAPRYNLYVDPYNGNTIKLGGFSGLFPVPCRPDWVYVVTDRGPNPDYVPAAPGTAGKIFIRPDFGPQIVTLHLHPSGTAKIAEIMPLKNLRPREGLITGLAPTPTITRQVPEILWDWNLNLAPNDEDGIDTEGLTMDWWGNFWVCEEYKPSIAMVGRNGRVLLRLVPKGTLAGTETIPTFDILPGILKERYNNRGLEGIAFAHGIVYSIMQRPLSNPDPKASETNQNLRVVAVDLKAVLCGHVASSVQQFIYRVDIINKGAYASDLFAISASKFLVPERQTDKLYCFDITGATDITDKEDESGVLIASPNPTKTTIEQLTAVELAAIGITPVAKTVVLPSLTAIDPVLAKCEGVCLIGQTIVLTHDNDFNVNPATLAPNPTPGGPAVQVNLQDPPNLPRLFLVPLPPGILP